MIEASLLSLIRHGARARYIERDAPDLGRWLSEDIAGDDDITMGARWVYAERRLKQLINDEASPFYRDRVLIMLGLAQGMDGATMARRATVAAATLDINKWEGVSWHHYRYRRLPDEIRGVADSIYACSLALE